MLNEYFAPLNLQNMLIFSFILISWETIGTYISRKIQLSENLRLIYWFIGSNAFVFLWFLLHWFLPFSQEYVWISLIFSSFPFILWYIRKKEYISLKKTIFTFPFTPFFLLPIIRQIFFMISRPPHRWDELAYHFYSPARLLLEKTWPYGPFSTYIHSIYDVIPRQMDTAYVLLFSLTKTYATAQLFHFTAFICLISIIAMWIRKNINLFSALIFTLFSLYFFPELIQNATEGYIDAAMAGLSVVSLLQIVEFIQKPEYKKFISIAVLFSILIGIKYTSIAFIFSLCVFTIFTFLIKKMDIKQPLVSFITSKNIAISFLIALVFGGYWYIKNLLVTGNPIFPFLLPCFKGLSCGNQETTYMYDYVVPFTLKNIPRIIEIMFTNNIMLFYTTLLSIPIIAFIANTLKKKRISLLIITMLSTMLLEALFVTGFSGYQDRFYYHWSLYICMLLSIPFGFIKIPKLQLTKKQFIHHLSIGFIAFSLVTISAQMYHGGSVLFDRILFDGEDQLYARGKISLTDWLKHRFPNTYTLATEYCNDPNKTNNILILDSFTGTLSYQNLIKMFWTNCNMQYYINKDKENATNEDVRNFSKTLKFLFPDTILFTLQTCQKDKKATSLFNMYIQEKVCSTKHIDGYLNLYSI